MRLFIGSTGLPIPARPKPLYSFFPIYSPFQLSDDDGFYMGEDNRIKSIEIKDGALQFEVGVVGRHVAIVTPFLNCLPFALFICS